MKEADAARVIASAKGLDRALGDLDNAIRNIPDDAERRVFAKRLGDIVGAINDDFIRPLASQFPHLDPDQA
jgi:hypothetical protein